MRRIYKDEDVLHILRDEMGKDMPILYQLVFAYDADNSANITFVLRPTKNVTHTYADIVSVLRPTENVLRGWVNCKVTRPDGDIVSVLRPTENVLRGWVVTRPDADICIRLKTNERRTSVACFMKSDNALKRTERSVLGLNNGVAVGFIKQAKPQNP
nr:hypothetical protein [Tanacetum cinerariifolium]